VTETLVSRRRVAALCDALDRQAGSTRYHDHAVEFRTADQVVVVRPAFALDEQSSSMTITTGPLRAAITTDLRIGVLAVRLGGFAAVVYTGEQPTSMKISRRLVHARHRAGGSSANRFRRRREQQARVLYDAAAAAAEMILLPELARLDRVLFAGHRDALRRTIAARAALEPLAARAVATLVAIATPDRHAVEALGHRLYLATVTITPLADDATVTGGS
jgi:peptide subunit release factor 1 (eRF1)